MTAGLLLPEFHSFQLDSLLVALLIKQMASILMSMLSVRESFQYRSTLPFCKLLLK